MPLLKKQTHYLGIMQVCSSKSAGWVI